MATKKKLLQAAAGQAGGGEGLNVESLFSTYLYEGEGVSQVINNNIALGNSNAGSSVEFAGGSGTEKQSLSYANNANYVVGSSNNFTIEFFVYLDAVNDSLAFGLLSGYSAYLTGLYISSGSLFGYYQTGSTAQTAITTGQVLSAGQFYHVALVRNGATFTVYLDGTSVGTSTHSIDVYDASQFFSVGNYTNSDENIINGFVSNLRYSSTARYTSNFTPPTSDFANDSDTILLSCQGQTADLSSNSIAVTEGGSSPTLHDNFGPFTGTDGEGGMVWLKARGTPTTSSGWHTLYDTERGVNKPLYSNDTSGESTVADTLTSFNSNGFTHGTTWYTEANLDVASWTFRKAPKFFDVVTYTGNGTTQTISHNLGTTVGCIIVKRTDSTDNWHVYHRGTDASLAKAYKLRLNLTNVVSYDASQWGNTDPTSTEFTVGGGGTANSNVSGATYVAYLFAHNDGDGEFGPDGDADIIKCGSVTYTTGATVDLGFEPQWVLVKPSSSTGNWILNDVMRGMPNGSRGPRLDADTSGAELANATVVYPTSTGFTMPSGLYTNSTDLIYIAIRRGPMAVPESATDVFAIDTANSSDPWFVSGFPVDMGIWRDVDSTSNNTTSARLIGTNTLNTNLTSAQASYSAYTWDHQTGWMTAGSADSTRYSWMWKRAPNFFDVVAYTGDGTASHTINHNLGVVPEMIWTKNRSSATALDWAVYHSGIGRKLLILNNTDAETSYDFFPYDPTSSNWIVRNHPTTNTSGDDYIMYLFASLDGVSKVGSFTTTGSAVNVDCGFSSGARFVLLKAASGTNAHLYNWELYDTERGIVAGNDSVLFPNSTSAEYTAADYIDPYSAGFTFNSGAGGRPSGQTIIFYAIA